MMKPRAWESQDWKNLNEANQKALDNFREYLRIPSVHPNIDYEPCVKFLKKLANDVGLEFSVYRNVPKNPVVVLTWIGTEPSLPSILLNSHMDVVPVFEENWNYKPFNADVDENGNVYARGSQDAKSFGTQYAEAIRRLKKEGFKPKRTVHVSYLPDEETGGIEGMQKFIKSDEFKKLNIGFALDEGSASINNTLLVYYGEKRSWKFAVHCSGQAGHGSLLLDDTAGEKIEYILRNMYKFRATQREKNSNDVVTVNLTMLMGGVQANVIPPKMSLVFDTRSPVADFKHFEALVLKWCEEAGKGVEIETYVKDDEAENTKIDQSNPYWIALKTAVENLGLNMDTAILSANTDARFLRVLGIPTFGFSPSRNTPKRSHNDNEYLNINVFLDGITIYKDIIAGIANV
ncbi:hypothetical protein RN001_011324 [Aquatica leii]|uniref:N-acyl-aliphatic-L-amino acid amidohydrolase n=1 Tax=Aquatica leii TaxID=1421715 RepID=A0AAN7SNP4_9COLE|nr:hypothetical protein RN001_011324 [Aquatica leii]